MDDFNAGMPSPHALRAFLSWASLNWQLPPRYVVLAGEGTLDYRNLLGYGDNLVPPLMIQSAGGLFPSDNRLGDVNGDGLPEMAVGRVPVLSAAELDAYTAKIAAYESDPAPSWAGNVTMLADAPDQGADFTADSERIAGQVPASYTVERIHLASTPLAAARGQLIASFHQGTAFINYTGHGGLDRLSGSGLLSSGDVPGLANGSRLPVLTAMTCTVNRFAVPGVPALGEVLVKSPAGGAAAVWGPSGLSDNGEARLLAERFYHSAGNPDPADTRLGDRILRAIAEFRSLGGDPNLPKIYDLLGDPALRLPVPPSTASAPEGTGE
jgi:peptidase C25-like protein